MAYQPRLRDWRSEGMVTRIQGSKTQVAELHHISSRLTIRDIKEVEAQPPSCQPGVAGSD
jgi:predicted Zn-dependent protease